MVEPSLADLSEIDRTFLLAMAQDNGESKLSDLAVRLNVDGTTRAKFTAL